MRVLIWLAFAATVLLVALQGVLLAASSTPLMSYDVLVDQAFPLLGIGAVVGAGVGALIVSRYPHNVIGWMFLVSQLGQAVGLAAAAFAAVVADGTVDAPMAGRIALYGNQFLDATFTVAIMAVIFMIVPDGRLLSRRWRAGVGLAILAVVLRIGAIAGQPSSSFVPGEPVRYTGVSLVLLITSFFALLAAVTLGGVALVLRLRRSAGQQRLQLRWISTAGAALAGIFVVFALDQLVGGPAVWLLTELTLLAYIFLPVAVGVAILRYRLYDIDVILSKAIVLGTLAVFVTVGYIAVVVAIGWVLAAVTTAGSTPYWPSLVASALVAAAFQPLRRHVLRLADQLVYGSQAAPYEALAALSRQLADSPSPDALPGRVAQAAGRAVGAARTVVFLGTPDDGAPLLVAGWPEDGRTTAEAPTLRLPVLDRNEQVGSIEVCMPPGRALRTFERRLLQDVAAQAGVAFRNALLEAELAARVAEGQAWSAELADSRRRLVGVEDEARERLAAAIRRSVVPHLAAVETGLAGHGPSADRTLPPDRLEPLIAETEQALEELRSVCRGVFPALLERRGLVPALISQLDASHPLCRLDVAVSADRRLDRAVEAAGYQFCVDVAPTDRPCVISLRVEAGRLVVTITGADIGEPGSGSNDDVPNATQPAKVSWQHAEDRVAALDGRVLVERMDDGSVAVRADIPLPRESDQRAATLVSQ
jgi:signal transduction histidine kinase